MPVNNVQVLIGGTDVSDRVRSVTIDRGRRLVNDPLRAGTCTVQLYNNDGALDPWDGSSSLNSIIRPGAGLVVRQTATGAVTIFTGYVDRWRPEFTHRNQSYVTVDGSDIFSNFAQARLDAITPVAQPSDQRALMIVTEPQLSKTFFSKLTEPGAAWLGSQPIPEGTSGLAALQAVHDTEQGDCFIDRTGAFRFTGRYTTSTTLSNLEFRHTATGGSTPPRVAVGITDIEGRSGTEDMINRVVVSTVAGGAVPATGNVWTLDDSGSQTTYNRVVSREMRVVTALDVDAYWVGLWVLSRQNLPTFFITAVETVWNAAPTATAEQMLTSDISDLVRVVYRGPSGTDYNTSLRVLGISHRISGRNEHRIRWHLGRDLMNVGFFTIGTDQLGGTAPLGI